MAQPNFVHLHVHSHYSLLDGLGKVPELVGRAKELGMPALAITDHGVMYGAIEFFNECKKAGIKPIIGQEAYIAPHSMDDRTSGPGSRPFHMILLAKNLAGYKNLIKITSAAHLDGYYYKPRVDRDFLSRHSEGLIASSACLASETSRLILDKNFDELETTIQTYREMFGKDSYYLELQHHPSIPEQQVVNEQLKRVAEKLKFPLIATNDTHYVNSEDHVSHDQLVCIQTGKLVSDSSRMIYTGDFSLKTPQEMSEAFTDVPQALENTVKIADLVDLDIPLDQNLLPKYPVPKGETEASYLKHLCEEGLAKRFRDVTPEIRSRLDYELGIVNKMGYPGYFLAVWDFAKFAREKGIYYGCRGSAAGSLISYVIEITNIDPLRYDLLFERFLDLNRISMPDIDMDFEDSRRGEIIDYARTKYGDGHVAGIITFGTIMARAAVRDVGRVLGVPYNQVDAIAKVVPAPIQGRHTPLSKSVGEAPELKQMYDNDPQAKMVLDSAMKLEGTIRHASQHACAVVISNDPLEEYAPVQQAQGGDVHQVTQYSMGPIEKIGLLKMDFLGLANYTILRQCCEIIEAVYGAKVDVYNLPENDKKTFELFGKGETTGVFQLESSGMKRYIKELRPNKLEDIVAMVALYRPGPMQWIQSFIDRKNGKEKIEYLHPLAKDALKDTYGIPVYQEQVMRMSKDMCGFTGAEADTMRKAVGKKIPKLMAQMKEKFISGAVKNGVAETKARDIWKQLEDFAAYCFNKSHAVSYATIAYQTAYLKAHYPDCFMAALMTSDLDNTDRLSIEISECEHMGLKVLPPDVDESFAAFAVIKEKKAIRFGLGAIKNVGTAVAKAMVRERKTNGPYETLEDFLSRNGATLNKKVLDSLVRSGALDRFGARSDLHGGLELLVKYASGGKGVTEGQLSIFAEAVNKQNLPAVALPTTVEDKTAYLTWEKELLGLYLSDHPLKQFPALTSLATPIATLSIEQAGKMVRVAGILQQFKKITTKAGAQMAFAELEDLTGQLELIVFPTILGQFPTLWQTDKMVIVDARISDKDSTVKLLAERVWDLKEVSPQMLPKLEGTVRAARPNGSSSPAKPNGPTTYMIDLPSGAARSLVPKLKSLLEGYPGPTPVELRIAQNGLVKAVRTKLTVEKCADLDEEIAQLFLDNF